MSSNKDDFSFLSKYIHSNEEFPVLSQQTHFVIRNGKIISERIDINENLMHYVQDTAQLISVICGECEDETDNRGFDCIVYLDKSARPVSWLVNLFWDCFSSNDEEGHQKKRPPHVYANIDRAPWFRNVGIDVTNDGRQKSDGELASFSDFLQNKDKLTSRHLSAIRSLFIPGGIEREDPEEVMRTPTGLAGKRILVVDEVARTGATLSIAAYLIRAALPEADCVEGTYFWHPQEAVIKIGTENMLTSLPVWYDPNTLTGRGIGGINEAYYRKRYEYYLALSDKNMRYDLKKLRAQAFAAPVFSAPLLKEDGTVLNLKDEIITRRLSADLIKLANEYKNGTIFFTPPIIWPEERIEREIRRQGAEIIPENAADDEMIRIRNSPRFYLNIINAIRG